MCSVETSRQVCRPSTGFFQQVLVATGFPGIALITSWFLRPEVGVYRYRFISLHFPEHCLCEDVSLSKMGEKSPLPAIVVTPSSPSCSADFSIAFQAPPEKLTATQQLFSLPASLNRKARTTFLLLLLLFVMACHLFTHRLATRHPHLQFGIVQSVTEETPSVAHSDHHISWLNWQDFWGVHSDVDDKREFVVAESL